MRTHESQPLARLSMRYEGSRWNAYYTTSDKTAGAVLIGSVKMSVVINNYPRREKFMHVMRDIFNDIKQQTLSVGRKP